jgi:hypothetical protein
MYPRFVLVIGLGIHGIHGIYPDWCISAGFLLRWSWVVVSWANAHLLPQMLVPGKCGRTPSWWRWLLQAVYGFRAVGVAELWLGFRIFVGSLGRIRLG